MSDMPEKIYAYEEKSTGTGTWIDRDDSCKVSGDIATEYIRKDKYDVLKEKCKYQAAFIDQLSLVAEGLENE